MDILLTMFVIFLVLAVLYLLAIMPRMIGRPDRTPFVGRLYAHRGLHDNHSDAPENSMAAFVKAVEAGYGIELDVQLSKDKVPVIFHDSKLERVCGVPGDVRDYTYEELQQFNLCDSGEKIPTLKEFLEMVDGRVPLIIEYKISGANTEVCEVAEGLLQDYRGLYCVESFNPLGVLWYRRNKKEILRGQLATSFAKEKTQGYPGFLLFLMHHLLFNFIAKPDFISYEYKYRRDLSRSICKVLYRAPSAAWTIKNQEDFEGCKGDFEMVIFDSFIPQKD